MSGKRFLERRDIKRLIGQAQDFTIRWRGLHVLMVGSALIILAIALALLWVFTNAGQLDVAIAFPIFLLIFVTIGLVVAFHFAFTRITYVEFLCLLFASSAKLGSEFLMILNRRGIVIYCDDNYDKIFRELSDIRDFQEFLALDGIKKEHADALVKALMEREEVTAPFEYKDTDGKKVKVELSLKPLARPANYNLLRAVKVS